MTFVGSETGAVMVLKTSHRRNLCDGCSKLLDPQYFYRPFYNG